jgi:uncharacterized protein (TIGR03437 family)
MHLLLFAAFALTTLAAAENARHEAPVYTIESVVNSATNRAGPIAPNTLVSVYGTNLCLAERGVSAEDLRGGILPNVLPGTGCRVLVENIPASIYYASPKQINFLIPSNLLATKVNFQVILNGVAGPAFKLPLSETAPGLFQADSEFVIATRPDGTVITRSSPAAPGDIIILYATGLGRTTPAAVYSQIATTAARLARALEFRLVLQGEDVERERLLYVGLTPGFAGLYQINLKLPENVPPEPEIRIGFGESLSPEAMKLPVGGFPASVIEPEAPPASPEAQRYLPLARP